MTKFLYHSVSEMIWAPGEDHYLQAEAPSLVIGVGEPIEFEPAEHEPKLTRLAGIQGSCIRVHSSAFHRNKLPPGKIYGRLLTCTRCQILQVSARSSTLTLHELAAILTVAVSFLQRL